MKNNYGYEMEPKYEGELGLHWLPKLNRLEKVLVIGTEVPSDRRTLIVACMGFSGLGGGVNEYG